MTCSLFPDEEYVDVALGGWRARVWGAYKGNTEHPDWRIVKPAAVDPKARAEGRGWPENAETMIGQSRLDNIQSVTNVLEGDIPGDLIEAGVWRGGAAILMRAVLAAHGEQ